MDFQRLTRKSAGFRRILGKLALAAEPLVFRRKLGDTEVVVRLQKTRFLEIRVMFKPPVSYERGVRIVSRLGLRGPQERWR